jgi:hypothetical protein
MKLIIKRDQAKSSLGGVKFEVFYRVELTPEEAELIKKYKANNEPLLCLENGVVLLDIDHLVNGLSRKSEDLIGILSYEKRIKDACKSFKNYLELMATFGGEEIIEF